MQPLVASTLTGAPRRAAVRRARRNALWHPQLAIPVALAVGCSQWNKLDLGPDVLFFDVLIVRGLASEPAPQQRGSAAAPPVSGS